MTDDVDADIGIDGYGLQNAMQDSWRLTPATFANELSDGAWIPAEHLLYISSEIAHACYMGLEQGIAQFLIVTMPPRHGKSNLISTYTPPWVLEHWPWANIILTTYGGELSTDFSRTARNIVSENQGKLSYSLSQDSTSVQRWKTDEGGGMMAVGVGGPITGRGAHVLLVDDYIKNAEDALSTAANKARLNWFKSTAFTRREPGCVTIILATRWVVDDLIGTLQKDRTIPWRVINLPAVAREGDLLGRKVGEALWKERYPLSELSTIKGMVGSFWWDAMYQQAPRNLEAGTFDGEWFPIVDMLPINRRYAFVRAWDFSAGKGDYYSGALVCLDLDDPLHSAYIVHIARGKKRPKDLEETVKKIAMADGPSIPIVLEQEPGSSGEITIDHYERNVLKGFSVTARRPTGAKEIRANPMLAAAESGHVKLVRGNWNQPFKDEVGSFPDGENDDMVDSGAAGYNELLILHKRGGVVWGRQSSLIPSSGKGASIITGVTWGRKRRSA